MDELKAWWCAQGFPVRALTLLAMAALGVAAIIAAIGLFVLAATFVEESTGSVLLGLMAGLFTLAGPWAVWLAWRGCPDSRRMR